MKTVCRTILSRSYTQIAPVFSSSYGTMICILRFYTILTCTRSCTGSCVFPRSLEWTSCLLHRSAEQFLPLSQTPSTDQIDELPYTFWTGLPGERFQQHILTLLDF